MSNEVLLTGRPASPPEVREVRAGPLRALFVDGDLRTIRRGEVELARRIYLAVRDLNWNTVPGQTEDLDISHGADSFAIRYTRRHAEGPIDYRWHADIRGTADGVISFSMRGEALADFGYAKIGICVHHPIAGYAGQAFRGRTPDGPVSGVLPEHIGPQVHLDDGTDLPLFDPVSDLELRHTSGGAARFRFTGDLWEMEDQRNWTDASYKSASTPASLGYHHEARRGQAFHQEVLLTATGFPGDSSVPRHPRESTEITLAAPTQFLVPPVGLGCADPAAELSAAGLATLRAISPAHLRIDVQAGSPGQEATLTAASALTSRLGCELELAVFLRGTDGDQAGLVALAASVRQADPLLARVLAFSESEESSSAATVHAVRAAFAARPEVPVIAGTNIYFNELNRHRLPPGRADGLAWSVNPQIHAFDELSLVENLQAQPDTLATARSFAPGTQLFVTPVTLRPRFNAVATTDEEFPDGQLPWPVDPRQPALFGAAWTLGSLAALASAGADGLTYYDTVGPCGVVESPLGSPSPEVFGSRPDGAYPLAAVLADVCGLRGMRILGITPVDPASLTALAARAGDHTVLLLGNLTRRAQRVTVRTGPGARGQVRVLDEDTCRDATADLAAFLRSGTGWAAESGTVTIVLNPYAVARLDMRPDAPAGDAP